MDKFSNSTIPLSFKELETSLDKLPEDTVLYKAREKIFCEIFERVRKKSTATKILLLDEFTVRIMADILDSQTIIENGISLIENISHDIPSDSSIDAIYFIGIESYKRLLMDYMPDSKFRKFGHALVFFSGGLTDEIADDILSNKEFKRYCLTLASLQLEFIIESPYVCDLSYPQYISEVLKNTKGVTVDAAFQQISKRLLTVVDTVGLEVGQVRYVKSSFSLNPDNESSRRAERCANLLVQLADVEKIQEEALSQGQKHGHGTQKKKKCTVIVLDRGSDILPALIHEFSYNALIRDHFPEVKRKTVKIDFNSSQSRIRSKDNEKEVRLSETDPIWTRYRYMFFPYILNEAEKQLKLWKGQDKFKELLKKENQLSDRGDFTNSSSSETGEAFTSALSVHQIQEFTIGKQKFALHNKILQKLNDLIDIEKLGDILEIEEASLSIFNKNLPKGTDGKVLNILTSENVSQQDKFRLLLASNICLEGGINQDSLNDYIRAIASSGQSRGKLNVSMQGITNALTSLVRLTGLTFGDSRSKSWNVRKINENAVRLRQPMLDDQKTALAKQKSGREEDTTYIGNTYKPLIYSTIKDYFANKLNTTDYPLVEGGRISKSGTARSSTMPLIILILGGVTDAELRAVEERSRDSRTEQAVYLVGTDILNPIKFLEDLQTLEI
ncbi:MAG: putative syntaxin-binding protein 1 [Streblomastix strix]|uniref:Putative syntaxin-binding protein 1 n=1 Tax=Streblomastix strix TaxID=222440 RepID=A0A5J4WWV4_9EUKA|nr:MAG: putative syntaxin-binding protein 1 [Streblomastix strix]